MKLLFLVLLGLAVAHAQPACRVYKSFTTSANTGMVQDTVNVPESFPVASAKVSNMVIGHPDASTLQLTLLHRETPASEFSTIVLKPSDDLTTFIPEAPLNGASAGQWVVRITDSLPGSEGRVITLQGWALTLCMSDAPVTASSGPEPVSSTTDVSVNVSTDAKADEEARSANVGDAGVKGIMELLFPGLKADQSPDGVLGAVSLAKQGVAGAVDVQVADALKLVADKSEVYKNFVNKKISDTISLINAGGTGFEGLINNRGNLFNIHDKSLRGFIQNLKASVAADAQDKVDHVLTTASRLTALGGALTGDLKSTTGLLKQLVVAALSNTGKVYTTVEGAAKTHVDGVISAKASILEGVLDKIIAALSAAEGAKLTGPAVDLKLRLDVAKLKALQAALDKVDEAIRALPTPSQVVVGKVNAIGGALQKTRVAELLGSLDDGPIISHLISKVNTARDMLRKTTETVTATGN